MPLQNIFLGFIFFLSFSPLSALSETITLVADEWPPFNSIPDSSEEGFMVDVARSIFEKNGIRVFYTLLPWRRAIESTRAGLYNGIIGASKTDAQDFIFPSEEMSRNYLSFYVRKDSVWEFKNRSDINSISLGVIVGYDYRKWLLDHISRYQNNPEMIQVMTGNQPLRRNVMKLLDKRIDAIVDNEAVILNIAREMGVSDKIRAAGYGSEPAYIYIAFSPVLPNSQRYAKLLSVGIVQLRNNGRLNKILLRYGLKDWK